ncbi:MAG: class II aldolase/adducin family protein [Anaerolineaceae bacterium]|nr:class II aldolase/adducin family protein [Anaerolineaceae bacterium]
MAKIILTDEDIEKIVAQGSTTLVVDDNMILTDLAYEKAKRLGVEILQKDHPRPPSAPVRPYLTQNNPATSLISSITDPSEKLTEVANTGGISVYPSRDILQFNEFSSEQQIRDAIILTGRILYHSGLMVSNDGNISARMADGNILITPSGVTKGRISAEDLLVIDLEGRMLKSATNPALKPTSEQPMHLEIFKQRPDVRAVIHTHLIYANALAISQGKVRMDVIPEAAIAFGEIPITEFSMPSSRQNAAAVRDLVRKHNVLLIRNHGSIAVGKNLDEALINTERLEHVCKTLTYAELLGDVNTLPPEMLDAIRGIVQKNKKIDE